MHHDRTAPVERHKVPRQRATDHGDVNEPRGRTMAEVRAGQVEEVDNQQQLSPPEVAPHPEVNKPKQQQIMRNKMAPHITRSGNIRLVARIQMPRIPDLQNIKHDPVDTGDNTVHGEGSVVVVVLAPDGVAMIATLVWTLEGVVDAGNGEEEPGEGGADFVGEDGIAGALAAVGEGVYGV